MSNFEEGGPSPNLTEFEQTVISRILEKDAPNYLAQLELLQVTKRELSGVGQFVRFHVDPAFRLRPINELLGGWLCADICGVFVSFSLTSTDGLLDMLEMVVSGVEAWPSSIDNYKLFDLNSE